MTIHHQIVKSAMGRGVNFAYPDEDTVEAKHEASGLVVRVDTNDYDSQNDAAREAWDIVQNIADYNAEAETGVRISQDLEDRDFVAIDAENDDEEIARDPTFVDLLVSVAEWLDAKADEEDEREDADEEDERGSVVPAKYKAIYAEAGHPTHCGDWLAETLNRFCRVTDAETGKETTDLDALETIANANDVAPERYGKLGVATNGWQGRYRMTIRNMLTPRCAAKGFIFIPDGVTGQDEGDMEIKAPEAWCREHAPKVKAKVEKTDAEKAKKPEGKKAAKAKAMDEGVAAATAAVKAAKAKAKATANSQ